MKLRLLPLAIVFVAACGGGGSATSVPTVPSVPTASLPGATATPALPAEIEMCSLMPLGDVQAASPFSTPLAEADPGTPPSMCEYRSANDADEPVGVLLVVTDFGSPEGAATHMAAYRENMELAGLVLSDVAGVGDEAVSSGVDEVGVHAIVGKYAVDANLGGEWPDTTDASKVAAATSLLQTLISRLP